MRQGAVPQVGVDLLDDRVLAVDLVRGHGVEVPALTVVKNAWNRYASKRVPCPSVAFKFSSEIRCPTSRAVTCLLFLGEENAVKDVSATSAAGGYMPATSSKAASVQSMLFRASAGMEAMCV
ncbi:MAG: hypothetical protein QJR09_00020 [Micrococcus sp.]|nr:hypothetical protein [Micrococcus sp.]